VALSSPGASPADRARLEELELALAAREQALVDFRRAASAHLAETAKLRAALGEQASLVGELEESLALAESSAQAVGAESARQRAALAETETADRARRSRLAELEGTLLRLSRQIPAAAPAPARDVDRDPDGRAPDVSSRLGALETQLVQATRLRDEAERRWGDAASRILDLENTVAQKVALARDSERDRDELAVRLGDITARADAGRLGAAMEEVARLREALQRSEEQLWDAKSQLLLARERIGSLERELAAARSALPAALPAPGGESPLEPILVNAFEEMAALEVALRSEVAELVAIGIVLSEATREPGPDRAVAAAGERAG
jgi:chromosome segregation ATPase